VSGALDTDAATRDTREEPELDEPARDLADRVEATQAPERAKGEQPPVTETEVSDVRDAAADEPEPADDDTVRTPSADETADTIRRAQRALGEIQERHAVEQREAEENSRAEQLTRWHCEDTAEREAPGQQAEQGGPALDMADSDA
jgi:hypothetical protein